MTLFTKLHRNLDPLTSLGEIIFGLMMVLTFTIGARLMDAGEPVDGRELLLAAIGCNLSWGLIDGFLYLISCVYERRRTAQPQEKVRATWEDVRGAALAGSLVLATAFPAILPFLVLNNGYLALRISNGILIALLFLAGFIWGRQVGSPRPWLAGLMVMSIGCGLVLVAIPLGG